MAIHLPQHSILGAVVSVALLKSAPGQRIEVSKEELEDNLQRLVHVNADFESDHYTVMVQRDSLYRDAERSLADSLNDGVTDISAKTNIAFETDVHGHTYIAGPGACRGS
jgi:hypothetical protein